MKYLQGKCYFDTLVTWEDLEALLDHFEEEEQVEASELIISTLDCAVMETVLHHLDESHHHHFLDLCHAQYNEPSILIWLEDRVEGITHHLKQTILITHQGLYELLISEKVLQE